MTESKHSSHTELPPVSQKTTVASKYFLVAAGAVILVGLAFWAGTAYEKGHQSKTVATANSSGLTGGRFGGGRSSGERPIFGQVTAISSSSISVQDSRTGSTSTLGITSSTTITDGGQSVSYTDIQTGDTVAVISNSSSTADATRILVNPSFGGGGGGSPQSPSSSGTSDTQSNSSTVLND
ncbi:MAG TPA: hypothetical protein VMR28_03045 [Candidatus Saccharimonadales bacterium]|nr:hypothetical protein [Candidatus Saccharimonadales bacterium]